MRIDLNVNGGDKIYIENGEWKLGKIVKKENFFNNSLKVTFLNLKNKERDLLIDKRLTNYIYYDILNDSFFASKLYDNSELFWLMYIFYPEN